MKKWKKNWKKVWYFIWEDNSIWSWIVNILLAFVLIKFIVYPGLGLILSTSHPVVAVVSESMEHASTFDPSHCHNNQYYLCGKCFAEGKFFNLDNYWEECGEWYASREISKKNFSKFPFKNGFNKGDIMVLRGKKAEDIETGYAIVFWSAKKDPIIHRVVKRWQEKGIYYFQTKGDHNPNFIIQKDNQGNVILDETSINQEQIVGSAVLRIPLLGYIKIWFVEILDLFRGNLQKGILLLLRYLYI